MKFSTYKYSRPDMDDWKKRFHKELEIFKNPEYIDRQLVAIKNIYTLRAEFESMREIAGIRYTINTNDKFYEEERNYFDDKGPVYEGLIDEFYECLIHSHHRFEFEKHFGSQIFRLAELSVKTFKPEIIADLQLENHLSSEYTKLKASASILFEGEERNLSGMIPFKVSDDRKMRIKASKAYWGFMEENTKELDRIYFELVRIRNRIARKLGYNSFVDLGYDRMQRTDYDARAVANFRKQILEDIVPLATKIREKQAKRLGLDSLKYYDEDLIFKSGNPKPKGDAKWIMERGQELYSDLSGETKEFFDFMLENELMDLETKKGKAGGGYCTYIAKHKAPFIFSNFNGTEGDIFVLTHEAGHAFQVYMSRNYELNEYNFPTMEACEIHSMSMEFFTWPWMDKFFNGDADKFRYLHIIKAILFLPYGVAVDEFQHYVYEHPGISMDELSKAWRKIERKYLPHRDYDGNEYLESGRYWQIQSHIYQVPFYYIDYTLAQICAFQFWMRSRRDRKDALNDYIRLCKQGGSKGFLDLVDYANLKSPFRDGSVKEVAREIEKYLADVNDLSLDKVV